MNYINFTWERFMYSPMSVCPSINPSIGLSVQTRFSRKKKNIIGKVNATVKKYRAQVICNTGRSALKYFANPSIIGSITQAKRLKIIAFIIDRYRLIEVF